MRRYPLIALALGVAAAGCRGSEPAPVRNAILIVCDTLRADRLGVYGYERDVSPNLDAFAREAIVFEQAYSSAPMTQPAMSSLMTGKLPWEIGAALGNMWMMPPEVETLAEVLSRADITTAAVVSNWVLRRRKGDVGVQQGFEHFDDAMRTPELNRQRMFERSAADTTDAAIHWLDERQADEPFFLWVHYQDPHGPYAPPEEFVARFERPPRSEELVELGKSNSGFGQIPFYQLSEGRRNPEQYRNLYDAEISYFDQELGRLFDWLRASGLYDDSLIVFTSDHGEALGEHDYWFCHGENVHRGVVNVPLVLKPPAGSGIEVPQRRSELVGHVDLFPTILDAFGLQAAGAGLGYPLLGAPRPEGRVLPQTLWADDGEKRAWAASDGRYRLIWSREDPNLRLYDIRQDPGEERDLAASEPEQVERLRRGYEAVMSPSADRPRLEGSQTEPDEEDLSALRALGYADDE